MDSSVLKKILTAPPLAHKEIPNVMIFIENEPINAKAYVNLIGKKLCLPVEIYDSADNAIYDIETGLCGSHICYILNDEKIIKNRAYLTAFVELGEFFIVGFDGVKIPENFLRDNAQFIYTFEKGSLDTLTNYVKKKIGNVVSDTNIHDFVECSDYKLSQINNELDKAVTDGDIASFFSQKRYTDIRTIDNMTVMQMILNRDKRYLSYLPYLTANAVGSVLALYTMSRKRFLLSNDTYYAKLMNLCFKAHSSIIDGTMSSENAIKRLAVDIAMG